MKHFTKLLPVATALVALSTSAAFAQEYKLKVGVSTPEGYSYNVALAEFKKQVEEGSNGDIEVTVFPSSQMGGEDNSIRPSVCPSAMETRCRIPVVACASPLFASNVSGIPP